MALPTLALETHSVKLFSINKPVQFRPYTVGEEKILLQAMESKNEETMAKAMQTITSACVLDNINIKNLPSFDLEKLFLAIRCKSVSEITEFKFIVEDCPNEQKCRREIELNLYDIDIETNKKHKTKITLTDNISIVMRYPSIKLMEDLRASQNEYDLLLEIASKCIDQIVDGKKSIPLDEVDPSEIKTFLESLSSKQFTKIIEFFDTMPKLTANINFTCEKCGKTINQKIQGLANFFL